MHVRATFFVQTDRDLENYFLVFSLAKQAVRSPWHAALQISKRLFSKGLEDIFCFFASTR